MCAICPEISGGGIVGDPNASHRRIAILLIALVIVALAASAYGYFLSLPSVGGARVSSLILQALRLSMELNKTEFQQGENFTIKFLLENIGKKNLTIVVANMLMYQQRGPPILFDFDIVAENGTTVYNFSKDHVIFPTVYECTIMPGENLTQTYVWGLAIPDYSGKTMGFYLSSGSYSVIGVTPPRWAGGLIETDSESWASLETSPIAFVIG
jgi:hypothetical protein